LKLPADDTNVFWIVICDLPWVSEAGRSMVSGIHRPHCSGRAFQVPAGWPSTETFATWLPTFPSRVRTSRTPSLSGLIFTVNWLEPPAPNPLPLRVTSCGGWVIPSRLGMFRRNAEISPGPLRLASVACWPGASWTGTFCVVAPGSGALGSFVPAAFNVATMSLALSAAGLNVVTPSALAKCR
jgi:hypothetical protein